MTRALVAIHDATVGGVYYSNNINFADLTIQPTWTKYSTTGLANTLIKVMRNDYFTPYDDIYVQLDNDDVYRWNGVSWTKILDLATARALSGYSPGLVGYIAVNNAIAGEICIPISITATGVKLLKSVDYGANWTVALVATALVTSSPYVSVYNYNYVVCIGKVYRGAYTSLGGSAWMWIPLWNNSAGGAPVKIDPKNPEYFYYRKDSTDGDLVRVHYSTGVITELQNTYNLTQLTTHEHCHWIDPDTSGHQRIIRSLSDNVAIFSTVDSWANFVDSTPTNIKTTFSVSVGALVAASENADFCMFGVTEDLGLQGLVEAFVGDNPTQSYIIAGTNWNTPPYTSAIPYTATAYVAFQGIWVGEGANNALKGVMVYSVETDDYDYDHQPMIGDRSAHHVLSYPNEHAEDVQKSTPYIHAPFPGIAGYGIVSDGSKWIVSDDQIAMIGDIPAGGLITYVSGSLSNPPTEAEFDAVCGTPAATGAGTAFLVLDTDTTRFYLAVSTGTAYQYSPFISPAAGTPSNAISGASGAWCWFADPRAVYYNGYIYFGYISNTGNVTVHQWNNTTEVNGPPVVLHTALGIDDHGNPSLLIRDSDARIMAFYCAHGGPNMYQRISTNPEDASSWGGEVDLQPTFLGTEFSYPEPIQLTGEASTPIYLFWRNPYDLVTQAWWFSKSLDDGATWAGRTQLFKSTNRSAYMKVVQNGTSRIDFVVTDGHPYYDADVSIYHFYYNGGNYYKTDGTLIGGAAALPLDEGDITKVYDGAAGDTAWLWDIAINASSNPVITFATFPTTADHRYQYALWTGAAWSVNQITTAGGGFGTGTGEEYYSGGVVLDHDDPQIVYLSKVVSAQWEIYKYVTADGGGTWTPTAITTSSAAKNIRPVAVRNHGAANLKYLWLYGTYTTYTNYSMSIYGSDT